MPSRRSLATSCRATAATASRSSAVGRAASLTGNWIGTTTSGGAPLGNKGAGVSIEGASGVTIGSGAAGNGNTIAYNARGVAIISGDRHTIRGNRIYSNTTLDIDLANDGPTANDAGDGDTGANNRQNFPVLSAVQPSPTGGVSANVEFGSGYVHARLLRRGPPAEPQLVACPRARPTSRGWTVSCLRRAP